MADAIRPTQVPETFRETAATARTAPRGESSRTAAPQTPSGAAAAARADEGPATVVASRELGEGRAQISLSDGRTITRAANDMLRETAPDGHMRLSLPNGMLIERDAEGKTAGFDPATGKKLHVKVEQQSENGQFYFELKDSKGNHWLATSETLRFEVTNHAGTVHQKVASTNSMQLSTTTVLRGEDGAFHQETNTATVRPDGQVLGHGARNKSMHVTNEMVTVRQSNGNRVEIDLPYAIPFDLKSEATASPAPKAAPPAA
ncbi:MAG: hypothetical protein EB084_25120, partial [Proteobacteria bacterium]|nr:hypothetical protein [Pseudomonadota bacterium]